MVKNVSKNSTVWAKKAPYLSVIISVFLAAALLRWNLAREAEAFKSEFIRQNLSALAAGDVLALTPRLEALSSSYHWQCLEGENRGEIFFSRKIGACGNGLLQKEVDFGLVGNRDLRIKATVAVPKNLLLFASFLILGQLLLLVFIARSGRMVERMEHNQFLEKERAENAMNRSLAAMTAMLAHDARRPLSISRLTLDLLRESSDLKSMQTLATKYISELDLAVNHIDGLIADVMEMANHSQNILKVPLELASVIDSSLKQSLRVHPGVRVKFNFDLRHHHLLTGHRQKLERVLTNIIVNALESITQAAEIWFSSHESNGFIYFSIKNSGSLIPEESLPRLFEMFFTQGKEGGTGLGLAIAKKIIQRHGGDIWCQSEKNTNFPYGFVEFTMTLPLASPLIPRQHISLNHVADVSSFESVASSVKPTLKPSLNNRPFKIAIIDDSIIVQDAWIAKLGDEVEILCFDNPQEFLRAVHQNSDLLERLNLVVTDYYFDHCDTTGVEVSLAIKARHKNLPVVLSSDRDPLSFKEKPLSVDGIIGKQPLSMSKLLKYGEPDFLSAAHDPCDERVHPGVQRHYQE